MFQSEDTQRSNRQANPYDPEWESYFEERIGLQMKDNLKDRKVLLGLWSEQDGYCSICSQKITKDTGWNIHHIERRVDGEKNIITNRNRSPGIR
jgi:RNA-directed DNA polymerase